MGYLRTTHYSTTTKEVEPTEESLKELLSHEAEKTALEFVQDIGNSLDSEVTYKTKVCLTYITALYSITDNPRIFAAASGRIQ